MIHFLPEQVLNWDKNLFLTLNGCHSPFFDCFMWMVSSLQTWVPAIIVLLCIIFKDKKREFFFILLGLVLTIVLCDQISSSLIKPLVERLRPSREPLLQGLVHLVNGYTGGMYGFVSSHAANSFGFALFSALIFRYRPYSITIFAWALVNSYSRIYLGVHYPLDIIGGALVGIFSALLVYFLFSSLRKFCTGFTCKTTSDTSLTSCGFSRKNLQFFILFLVLNMVFISIFALEMKHFINV